MSTAVLQFQRTNHLILIDKLKSFRDKVPFHFPQKTKTSNFQAIIDACQTHVISVGGYRCVGCDQQGYFAMPPNAEANID